MLKSIDDNWVAVYNILSEKGAERLMDVNRSTLKMLVGLLESFERIFKELQTCSSPSICFVLPSITKICVLCEPNISDISSIATLKETIKTKVVGIWTANLTIWHKVAFFCIPRLHICRIQTWPTLNSSVFQKCEKFVFQKKVIQPMFLVLIRPAQKCPLYQSRHQAHDLF